MGEDVNDRGYKLALKWVNAMRKQDGLPRLKEVPDYFMPEDDEYFCWWNPGQVHWHPCDESCLERLTLPQRAAAFIRYWCFRKWIPYSTSKEENEDTSTVDGVEQIQWNKGDDLTVKVASDGLQIVDDSNGGQG